MPQVGKKKFAYTKAGKKKAKMYAKKYTKKVKKGQIMKIYKGDQNFMKSPKKKPGMVKQIVKKGLKFGVKLATHPLSLAIAAAPQVYKLGKAKSFKYSNVRQFDKRGRKVT